jgi:hypothetical protein
MGSGRRRRAAKPITIGLCSTSTETARNRWCGLLIRGSEVRILPGASRELPAKMRLPNCVGTSELLTGHRLHSTFGPLAATTTGLIARGIPN